MKTFLKILAGLLIALVLAAVGLNLYFTDERLKQTVMPYVDDAVGREVQVESLSLTFFSTFPSPGIQIRKMSVPGETEDDTLLSLNELVIGVELLPLLSSSISISEIQLDAPRFTYRIESDGSTNLDFLLSDTTETAPADTGGTGYAVAIPYFAVTDARISYIDRTSDTELTLEELNGELALRYDRQIISRIDLSIGGIHARSEGTRYLTGLPVTLKEESTLDMERETLTLDSGTLGIQGLNLNLSGTISDWGGGTPAIDLAFNSSSDNFGELLRLVPPEYEDQVAGLETRGTLRIEGNATGTVGGEAIPQFTATVAISDGYLKNPDLPRALEQIQLSANASNERITLETLRASAGENTITASGSMDRPLDADARYQLQFDGAINLSTVNQLYPLDDFDIEQLSGQLTTSGSAEGRIDRLEQSRFNADFTLENGLLKYASVSQAIENITVDAQASDQRIQIKNLKVDAAGNRLTLSGTIDGPMEEVPRLDLNTSMDFDLATLKQFYPIDEDTLRMEGQLAAEATLKGPADPIERAVTGGSITLRNGFIAHKSLGRPIDGITLESSLSGNTLTLTTASFKTGGNELSLTGSVKNYLSDNPAIDLKMKGDAQFAEIQNYYDLRPTIHTLTGSATMNLAAKGRVKNPAGMTFSGGLTVSGLTMEGDSLVQPVRDLNGELKLSPKSVELRSLSFLLGSSDFHLEGQLRNYMEYLKAEQDRSKTPRLKGTYSSRMIDMDELIDWEDTTSAGPVPIHLPDLNSSVTASIDTLIVTGVTMYQLKAQAGTTPKQIKLDRASVRLFDGKAEGQFTWDIPKPTRTELTFKGSLDSLQSSAFFREYPIMGKGGSFHNYVKGAFSAKVTYNSELDEYLEPVIATTTMNGEFGMTKARVKGHPLQEKMAALFQANELNNLVLDEWITTFKVEDEVLSFENFKLTSGNIGMEMSGTQHLTKGTINYQVRLNLPGKYKDKIASVISKQAANALEQENGTIMVPLRVTGTQENPNVRPDQDAIKPIIKEFLKNKAKNVVKDIFGGSG